MKKIKNIILSLLICSIVWVSWADYDFPYNYIDNSTSVSETEIGKIIQTDVIDDSNSSLNRLLELFNLSDQWWYNSGTSKAIYYAKMIVNMLLSFVSLIALVMLIYAFYMIFFSKEDSGITKAKQMIKWVVIAIGIIWLSRFIVSMIFWVQSQSANDNQNSWTGIESVQ